MPSVNGALQTHGPGSNAGRRGLARTLLCWAADASDEALQRLAVEVRETDERQLQHLVAAGLAPLLHYAVGEHLHGVDAQRRDLLKSAEFTARFAHAALREGAGAVVDACRDAGVGVTLLKGISIGVRCYPAPHLRPMGDVDVLLSEADCSVVDALLRSRGYTPLPGFRVDEREPHVAPLFDPRRHVWIELHRALFHKDAAVSGTSLFDRDSVARSRVPCTFEGRSVFRLSDELQLAYIACYWLRDLTRNRIHATSLIPLFDALYLLRASRASLDWERLFDSLDNEMAIVSLYVMLAQIRKYGFAAEIAPVLPRLADAQEVIGAAELRIIDFLLDTCLVDGRKFIGAFGERHPMIETTVMETLLSSTSFARKLLSLPWNFVFPPSVPDRYRVDYHARRIARLVKRSRTT